MPVAAIWNNKQKNVYCYIASIGCFTELIMTSLVLKNTQFTLALAAKLQLTVLGGCWWICEAKALRASLRC